MNSSLSSFAIFRNLPLYPFLRKPAGASSASHHRRVTLTYAESRQVDSGEAALPSAKTHKPPPEYVLQGSKAGTKVSTSYLGFTLIKSLLVQNSWIGEKLIKQLKGGTSEVSQEHCITEKHY